MIQEYFSSMSIDERLIEISSGNEFKAFLTFSICDDTKPYEDKDLFEYIPHNPNGKICFVEKLISKEWNKHLRRIIEEAIVSRYPSIEYAVWIRPSKLNERKVIYRRKHATKL